MNLNNLSSYRYFSRDLWKVDTSSLSRGEALLFKQVKITYKDIFKDLGKISGAAGDSEIPKKNRTIIELIERMDQARDQALGDMTLKNLVSKKTEKRETANDRRQTTEKAETRNPQLVTRNPQPDN